jgi:transcriptional regulator with XRE-family HTH domain
MKSAEEFVPNERLRQARSLKGWSQAELAEQVGTSFEIVSRWERGVTAPSPYYRERLCAVLSQSAGELGLLRSRPASLATRLSRCVARGRGEAARLPPQDCSARAGNHALEQPSIRQTGKRERTHELA